MPLRVVRKTNIQDGKTVLFTKPNFTTHCKSTTCTTSSNTRIFASHLQFGELHAILRGVIVKKIHIFAVPIQQLPRPHREWTEIIIIPISTLECERVHTPLMSRLSTPSRERRCRPYRGGHWVGRKESLH